MTAQHRTSLQPVGIWLRSAFADAAAAEFPPAVIALLDRLESTAEPVAAVGTRHSLSDSDFRHELELVIPHLRAYGRSIARDANIADDLLQETLAKAWAARDRFTAGTNMRAWTFTIYRNLFYSQMRRAKFVSEWNEITAARILVTPPAQHGVIELDDLYAALDHVPAAQRDAMLLVGAGGLAYEEAAVVLDCAVGTIKSRVSRGRIALAAVMAGEGRPARLARPGSASATDRIMADVRALEVANLARSARLTFLASK